MNACTPAYIDLYYRMQVKSNILEDTLITCYNNFHEDITCTLDSRRGCGSGLNLGTGDLLDGKGLKSGLLCIESALFCVLE